MSTTVKNTKYILIDEKAHRLEKLDDIFAHLTKVSREDPSARFKETSVTGGEGSQTVRTYERVSAGSREGDSVHQMIASLAEITKRQNIFSVKSRHAISDSTQQENLLWVFYDAIDMIHYKGRTLEVREKPLRALCDELMAAFKIEYKFGDVFAKYLKTMMPSAKPNSEAPKPTPEQKFEALRAIENKSREFVSFLEGKLGVRSDELRDLTNEMANQASKHWVVKSGKNFSVRLLENVLENGDRVFVYPTSLAEFTPTARKPERVATHTYLRTEPGKRILEPDQTELSNIDKRTQARKKATIGDSYIKSNVRVTKSAEEQARDEAQKKELSMKLVERLSVLIPQVPVATFRTLSSTQLVNTFRSAVTDLRKKGELDRALWDFIRMINDQFKVDLSPHTVA
jgi:hypothetical protein